MGPVIAFSLVRYRSLTSPCNRLYFFFFLSFFLFFFFFFLFPFSFFQSLHLIMIDKLNRYIYT